MSCHIHFSSFKALSYHTPTPAFSLSPFLPLLKFSEVTLNFFFSCLIQTLFLSHPSFLQAILNGFLSEFAQAVKDCAGQIVNAAVEIYNRLSVDLLPTPAKSHYVFNLRDLSKCVQGETRSRKLFVAPARNPFHVRDKGRFLLLHLLSTNGLESFQCCTQQNEAPNRKQICTIFGRVSKMLCMSRYCKHKRKRQRNSHIKCVQHLFLNSTNQPLGFLKETDGHREGVNLCSATRTTQDRFISFSCITNT